MRRPYVNQLYQILELVLVKNGGYFYLREEIPKKFLTNAGLYFFFDKNCKREDGVNFKIIRIGITKANDNPRLGLHKNGNISTSIFRDHVGRAIVASNGLLNINDLEERITEYIENLPYLVIPINNIENLKLLESKCIEIISNYQTKYNNEVIDAPPQNWLGYTEGGKTNSKIRLSHLWLDHHTKKYNENINLYNDSMILLQKYI